MLEVKIKKLHKDAVTPKYETTGSVGMDITATSKAYDDMGNIVYGTGLALEIPEGYYADLRPRSSICKYDLMLTNSVGTIDSDYRGEIMFKFKPTVSFETTDGEYIGNGLPQEWMENTYDVGDRIGQIVILPYPKVQFVEVEELSETVRGEGGFGSTNEPSKRTPFDLLCQLIEVTDGKEVRDSFIEQAIDNYSDSRNPLEYLEIDCVGEAFNWGSSKEGLEFWINVSERTRELQGKGEV